MREYTDKKTEKEDYKEMMDRHFEKIDRLFDIKIITPDNSKFEKTSGGFLSLYFEGETYPRVTLYRSFPFTEPDKYISVRKSSMKAEEIGMIIQLDSWPGETRKLIDEQIDLRYFSPVIKKISDIKEEYGFAYWTVLTDKGKMNFTTSIWSPITKITETRMMVSDLDSNRYEIEDFDSLSKKEKKMIDLFL